MHICEIPLKWLVLQSYVITNGWLARKCVSCFILSTVFGWFGLAGPASLFQCFYISNFPPLGFLPSQGKVPTQGHQVKSI